MMVSIARSFPIGAVMLLQTAGETRFQMRPVEGVELAPDTSGLAAEPIPPATAAPGLREVVASAERLSAAERSPRL
jgi:hypothetical protein